MCTARTQRSVDDFPLPCDQQPCVDSATGLCYYHHKMSQGLIVPLFEDATVTTAGGNMIYNQGMLKKGN